MDGKRLPHHIIRLVCNILKPGLHSFCAHNHCSQLCAHDSDGIECNNGCARSRSVECDYGLGYEAHLVIRITVKPFYPNVKHLTWLSEQRWGRRLTSALRLVVNHYPAWHVSEESIRTVRS
jgi:hypothetical protein